MDTFVLLKELLSQKTDVEITTTSTLSDIHVDSLDLVEVLLSMEEKLDVVFEDDELLQLKTVQDVIDLVNQKK